MLFKKNRVGENPATRSCLLKRFWDAPPGIGKSRGADELMTQIQALTDIQVLSCIQTERQNL